MGRQLAKISHGNAIIVMTEIIEQIQQFESLILPVVSALLYLTPLSFDVMSCILSTMILLGILYHPTIVSP